MDTSECLLIPVSYSNEKYPVGSSTMCLFAVLLLLELTSLCFKRLRLEFERDHNNCDISGTRKLSSCHIEITDDELKTTSAPSPLFV